MATVPTDSIIDESGSVCHPLPKPGSNFIDSQGTNVEIDSSDDPTVIIIIILLSGINAPAALYASAISIQI